MAQSIVDAYNNALQKLGANRVISPNDNSREARACNVAYDSNRRSELRKYRWNFAKTRVVLAPDVNAPAFGFTYQFTLPTDCLRVLIPKDSGLDWVIEGRKILTNTLQSPYGGATTSGAALSLLYISDITDPAQWDPTFFDMVTIAMAIDMVDDLTQSNTKKQLLEADYKEAKEAAKMSNAFELLPADAPDDYWWEVRY